MTKIKSIHINLSDSCLRRNDGYGKVECCVSVIPDESAIWRMRSGISPGCPRKVMFTDASKIPG